MNAAVAWHEDKDDGFAFPPHLLDHRIIVERIFIGLDSHIGWRCRSHSEPPPTFNSWGNYGPKRPAWAHWVTEWLSWVWNPGVPTSCPVPFQSLLLTLVSMGASSQICWVSILLFPWTTIKLRTWYSSCLYLWFWFRLFHWPLDHCGQKILSGKFQK